MHDSDTPIVLIALIVACLVILINLIWALHLYDVQSAAFKAGYNQVYYPGSHIAVWQRVPRTNSP